MSHARTPRARGADQGILRRGWITLFGAALGAALVFGNEILVARFLGVPSYGLYALSLVIVRIAETLSLFGLRSAVMHFLPVQRQDGALGAVWGTVIASVILPVAVGCTLSAALWFGAETIAARLLDEPAAAPFLRLFALPIPLMALTEVLGVITRGFGRAEYYVLIRNLTPPLCFMVVLLVYATPGAPASIVATAFGIGQLIATLVGGAVVAWLLMREDGWHRPVYVFRSLYGYAFPIMLNTFLYVIMGATDILMLGNMRGAAEAGVFRACIQLRPAFDMAMLAFNAGAVHLYPVLHRDGRHAELADSYRTVMRAVGGVSACLFVLVMLCRRDVLALLGPDFVAGADAMGYLLLGLLVQGCLGSAGMLLVVVGCQRHETLAAAVGVVCNVALNLLFIPEHGLVGAAWATGLSLLAMNLLRVYFVHSRLGLRSFDPVVLAVVLVAGAAGAVAWLASWLLGLDDGAGLGAMVARTGLACTLMAAAFWYGWVRRAARCKT
ncbi:MAG: flippase, partial [Acidobacteria bacterium]|nr:flippase [Acidobacteriota bacterium]